MSRKILILQTHYKNLNNMLFGKTMESLRKRMDLELVTNSTRAKKLIATPTTLHWDIIIENLYRLENRNQNNRRPTDLSALLYFGIVNNNNVQIAL